MAAELSGPPDANLDTGLRSTRPIRRDDDGDLEEAFFRPFPRVAPAADVERRHEGRPERIGSRMHVDYRWHMAFAVTHVQ